jgi:flavorubredoxin
MEAKLLFDDKHQWYVFARDSDKPENIIDTNQYMVVSGKESIVLDPGGIEIFSSMLSTILKFIPIEQITHLFASHQDPDIISSLGMWDQIIPNAKLYTPALWEGFIRHFGCENIKFCGIEDGGGELRIGNAVLQFIPAHYLHSSANFHVYDPVAKILFSGDIGTALEPQDSSLFIEKFDAHCDKMKFFHQRWMPSNEAKMNWLKRVRKLDIDMMLPQSGRIFRGKEIDQFFDWFEALNVGIALDS